MRWGHENGSSSNNPALPPKTNIPATELNTKQLSSKWTSKHEIAVVQPSKWSNLKSTNISGSDLTESKTWLGGANVF